MTLQNVAAAILVSEKQFAELNPAREAILTSFKNEFPYWNFGDWNIDVPPAVALILLKMHEEEVISIKQLILDLPAIAKAFKAPEASKPIE
jgi:hypothetical protein